MARRGRKPSSPPQRRPKGEGSLYYDEGRRRWIAEITVNSAGQRVRRRTSAKTREAAARALRDLLAEPIESDRRRTVAQLAEDWSDAYRRTGKRGPTTVSIRLDRVRRHIIDDPNIAGIAAAALKPSHVERWLHRKIHTGWTDAGGKHHDYSRPTISSLRGDLQQIMNWAVARRVVQWNPVPAAEIRTIPESAPRRTLTAEQAEALVQACVANPRPGWGTYVLTCLLLGTRPGEAAALRWDHIDFDAGTIRIDTAMKRAGGGRPLELGPLKTGQGGKRQSRTLEAPPILLTALRTERAAQAQDRLLLGSRWPPEWDGLVFVDVEGRPPYSGTLRRGLRQIVEQADLGVDDLTVYELRHSYASLLDEAGVAVRDIIDALGHTDDRMFYRVYRHRPDPIVRARWRSADEAEQH